MIFSKHITVQKTLSILLMTLGISWVLWLVFSNLDGNWHSILPKDSLWFLVTIGLGVTSQFLVLFIFLLLLREQSIKTHFFPIAKIFFIGQVIRYLPGRIWGIVYQTMNTDNTVTKNSIVLANIELMVLSFSILLTISFSILTYHHGFVIFSFLILMLGFSVTAFVLRKGWSSFFLEKAKSFIKKGRGNTTLPSTQIISHLSGKTTVLILGIVISSWLLYLLGWISLGKSGYGSTPYNMIILAASYSLSWFIGYISMVTPSGLGVRESSFLIIGYGIIPSDELALLAIIVRLWLLMIDIILFLIFTTKNHISRTRYA